MVNAGAQGGGLFAENCSPRGINSTTNPVTSCQLCGDDTHAVLSCPIFAQQSHNAKWEYVKQKRLCFICLQNNHRRSECSEKRCEVCGGPHHGLLHNYLKPTYRRNPADDKPFQHVESHGIAISLDNYHGKNTYRTLEIPALNTATGISQKVKITKSKEDNGMITRCMLPIVRSLVKNGNLCLKAVTLLDGGSEIHIMNAKLYKKLGLKGIPTKVNIVGVGGNMRKCVPKVEVIVEEQNGNETTIECIVLEKTWGSAVGIANEIINELSNEIEICEALLPVSARSTCFWAWQRPSYTNRNICDGIQTEWLLSGQDIVGPVPQGYSSIYQSSEYTSNNVSVLKEEK